VLRTGEKMGVVHAHILSWLFRRCRRLGRSPKLSLLFLARRLLPQLQTQVFLFGALSPGEILLPTRGVKKQIHCVSFH